MAKYKYITVVTKGVNDVATKEYNSLNKQVSAVTSLVREIFTVEEFPTYYIDETIRCFSNALKSKRTCKTKYSHTMLNGETQLKLIRLGA